MIPNENETRVQALLGKARSYLVAGYVWLAVQSPMVKTVAEGVLTAAVAALFGAPVLSALAAGAVAALVFHFVGV